MDAVAGVVLAGGRSSRMRGRDKAGLVLGGETLLARAARRLGAQVAALAVNANGPAADGLAPGLPVIADPVAGHPGPLAGMLAGLIWARRVVPPVSHLATVAVDTPFFPADLVSRLAAAAGPDGLAVAESGGRVHPVFALLPLGLCDDLAARLASGGSRRVSDWLAEHDARTVRFAATDGIDPFFNINSPEDVAVAVAAAGMRA